MRGMPRLIDFVAPTWMLNLDPDSEIESTSWRVSLEACLVKPEVLRRIGAPRAGFESLAAAALEFGHRCVRRGVLARHVPRLVSGAVFGEPARIPFEDELRFIVAGYGSGWARWALLRAILTGEVRAAEGFAALRRVHREPPAPRSEPFHEPSLPAGGSRDFSRKTVTVLIPTVDRYPYLRSLLENLRAQTVRPLEIVVVDQTALDRRDSGLARDFPDLPLRLMGREQPGQCSSRNAGIASSRGDFILFLDDDDEVSPDFIERHLHALHAFRSDVSSGVIDEVGAGPIPEAFRLVRASDVFPAGNSLVIKDVFQRSGLFDLAYDRGSRADGDLGMRLHLGGALMVLHPGIPVIHHHAPSGGLRTHRARVVTYASSKSRLTHRHLPARTELYLAKRYFTPRQVREAMWHRVLGTLRGRGGIGFRLAKLLASTVLLPHTLWSIRKRSREADAMLVRFPLIPAYPAAPDPAGEAR
jgi:glycosyltransferase involved in cell wall biosynthesis